MLLLIAPFWCVKRTAFGKLTNHTYPMAQTDFTLSATKMTALHTASFLVRDLTPSEELSIQRNEQLVTQVMEAVPFLRRLYINGVRWEVSLASFGVSATCIVLMLKISL